MTAAARQSRTRRPARPLGRKEPVLAIEPADVLIVGAGASGGVVARRLAEAGFGVVCLEQGDWHDRGASTAGRARLGAACASSGPRAPTCAGSPQDYPLDETDSDVIAADVQRRSAARAPLRGALAAPAAVGLPGAHARRRRATTGRSPTRSCCPYYERSDRDFGVSGHGRRPGLPGRRRVPPLPPLPIGRAGLKVAAGPHALGWHWWPEPNSIPSVPTTACSPCVQRGTCQQGCAEGAKASTDLTHWPKAIEPGARLITGRTGPAARDQRRGPRHRRRLSTATAPSTSSPRESWCSRPTGSAPPRLLLLSASPAHPDGLANSSGLVGRRLMMHPFANVGGLFDEDLESWQGQFGPLDRVASSSTRPTSGAASCAAPSGAWRRPAARSTRRCPGGPASSIWGPDHHLHVASRTSAAAPTGASSARTCPTRATG